MRSAVKGLLYDLASFTWVGWDEPGVSVSPSASAAGLAAARANLVLATELEKGDLALSRAHWMLGGHLLTSGRPAEAVVAFDLARDLAEAAGSDAEAELASAFAALCRLASAASRAAARLDGALDRLGVLDGGDMSSIR